jgi:hypothetical protein
MDEHIHKCGEWVKEVIDRNGSSTGVQKVSNNPKFVLYGVTLTCLITWLLIRAVQLLRNRTGNMPPTPQLEKAPTSIFKAPPRIPGGRCRCLRNIRQTDFLIVWTAGGLQTANCCSPGSQLGCAHLEADTHTAHSGTGRTITSRWGLRNMNWDEWIGACPHFTGRLHSHETDMLPPELDNHYLKFHADKAKRIA